MDKHSRALALNKAYVGFDTCGCPVWVLTAGYESQGKEVDEVRKALVQGLRIEVMTPEEARSLDNFLACPHQIVQPDDPKGFAEKLVGEARGEMYVEPEKAADPAAGQEDDPEPTRPDPGEQES